MHGALILWLSSLATGFQILAYKFAGGHRAEVLALLLVPMLAASWAAGALLLWSASVRCAIDRWRNHFVAWLPVVGVVALPLGAGERDFAVDRILSLAVFAGTGGFMVLAGALQTRAVQRSPRLNQSLLLGAAGLLAGPVITWALEHLSSGHVAAAFFAAHFAAALVFAPSWRATAIPLAVLAALWIRGTSPRDIVIYNNSFSTLRVAPAWKPDTPGAETAAFHGEIPEEPAPGLQIYKVIRHGHRPIALYDGLTLADTDFLKNDSVFNLMRHAAGKPLAVIGAGTGRDVLIARHAGARPITAIEINPLMIRATKDHMRVPSLIYDAPEVEVLMKEGRQAFRGLGAKRFDTIVLSNIGFFGSVLSTYFSENYLTTREAFEAYLGHLAPGGRLIFRANELGRGQFEAIAGGLSAAAAGKPGHVYRWSRPPGATLNEYLLVYSDRPVTTPPGFETIRPPRARVLAMTDNRPSFARHGFHNRNHVPVLLWTLLVAAALALAAALRPAGGRPKSALYLACGLTGFGFIGLQVTAAEWIFFASGFPQFSTAAALLSLAAFGMAGYWLDHRFPRLAVGGAPQLFLGTCAVALAAFFVLSRIHLLVPDAWPALLLGALLAGLPVLLSAQGFARLTAEARRGHGEAGIATALGVNAAGLLFGGACVKLVSLGVGQWQAFLLAAGAYLAAALVLRVARYSI